MVNSMPRGTIRPPSSAPPPARSGMAIRASAIPTLWAQPGCSPHMKIPATTGKSTESWTTAAGIAIPLSRTTRTSKRYALTKRTPPTIPSTQVTRAGESVPRVGPWMAAATA